MTLAHTRQRYEKHGQTGSLTHKSWLAMIARCENPKSNRYQSYGARGITVCPEWRASLARFISDVGERPSSKHSIDRIDGSKGYEPGNVRWATPTEQSRNRRSVISLTIEGQTRPLIEWCAISGIARKTAWCRLKRYGWSARDAIFTPALDSVDTTQRARDARRWGKQPEN